MNSGLSELGRKEWGYRDVSRPLLYFTVYWIQGPCLPIYRFSYQEEQNSLFYDSLRASAHVKLVWNVASSGVFGFQVPVLCCSSPLLLFLTWKTAFQTCFFGMGDMALPVCLILGWNNSGHSWALQLGPAFLLQEGLLEYDEVCITRVCMCENTLRMLPSWPSGF